MRFRKKLIVVDAVQWKGGNFDEIDDLAHPGLTRYVRLRGRHLEVESSDSGRIWLADKGDWVVRTPDDEIYLSRKELFEKTYEPHEN